MVMFVISELDTGGIYQCLLRILSGVCSRVEFPSEQGSSQGWYLNEGDSEVITDDL